tara:strand:- start:2288 stop:2401 length:114 start_codon:yes stop_codon:yes gene_type:complete
VFNLKNSLNPTHGIYENKKDDQLESDHLQITNFYRED